MSSGFGFQSGDQNVGAAVPEPSWKGLLQHRASSDAVYYTGAQT